MNAPVDTELLNRAERQADVVRALSAALPPHALLWQTEDTVPYECDGLTAYRQRPLAVQVSRFDRFKDPLGVIAAYRLARGFIPGLQLVLAGGGADDDPEGEAVLAELLLDQRKLGLDLGAESVLKHYQRWRRFDSISCWIVTSCSAPCTRLEPPGCGSARPMTRTQMWRPLAVISASWWSKVAPSADGSPACSASSTPSGKNRRTSSRVGR